MLHHKKVDAKWMTNETKCPCCGVGLQSIKELDTQAKDHFDN
jgi:hypothetical protein